MSRLASGLTAMATAVLLASCSSVSLEPSAPAPTPTPAHPAPVPAPPGTLERSHARWVPSSFAELPGWGQDRALEVWPALRLGCQTPPAPWTRLCAQAHLANPASDSEARAWLEQNLKVYRVESPEGEANGLVTGYFEPLVAASRKPTAIRRVPLYTAPPDLGQRKPYWTRQQLDTLPAAQAALKGREIAWVEDPLDALILQIQGSGRLQITEPDGRQRLVRLAFAGHNEQPYKSVGRWLIDQGELKPGEASWPGIKDWARRNPKRLQEMLWQNPRYVFFREEPLPDPSLGPKGAQAVPLTPGRSVAVDPAAVPYGAPLWLDTTEPLSDRPLQRLVMAQDTGSAIVGAVRVDYFWGWGDDAEAQAGRMKQPLRLWVLWPRL
ncbi:murein transglycosylase A [Ideonella oryzae]|uniref:peptidoglycan lytic exotransglycosylase n=1 Tax=Ideonella oryzae TaxID=2937441 RepID=A0ABT1BQQ9_9BURK|nr:MltA domain-containing protein [Ideonella oryzae]